MISTGRLNFKVVVDNSYMTELGTVLTFNGLKVSHLYVDMVFIHKDDKWDCNTRANTTVTLVGFRDRPSGAFISASDETTMEELPEEIKELIRDEALELLCRFPELAEKIESRRGYW